MQTFSNKDFYLSSWLVYNNFELLDHYREKNTTTFIFADSDKLRSCVNDYFSMKATVKDALTFTSVIRNLKTIIHSDRTSGQISKSQPEQLNNEFYNNNGEKL